MLLKVRLKIRKKAKFESLNILQNSENMVLQSQEVLADCHGLLGSILVCKRLWNFPTLQSYITLRFYNVLQIWLSWLFYFFWGALSFQKRPKLTGLICIVSPPNRHSLFHNFLVFDRPIGNLYKNNLYFSYSVRSASAWLKRSIQFSELKKEKRRK